MEAHLNFEHQRVKFTNNHTINIKFKMIGKFALLALVGCASANTQSFPNYPQAGQPVSMEARTGFGGSANVGFQDGGLGFQGGVNTPIGGFNGDIGLRAPTFANNNLMMGLIVFLGGLSLINILATVVTPWLTNLGGSDDDNEEKTIKKDVEKGRRFQRNINMMADYVLNGIESFATKHE